MNRAKWTLQEDKTLLGLVEQKLKWREIAPLLNRSPRSCRERLYYMGFAKNHPRSISDLQIQIMQCVADGYCYKQIAKRFGLDQQTIKNCAGSFFRMTHTTSITQAVLKAARMGWIDILGVERPCG